MHLNEHIRHTRAITVKSQSGALKIIFFKNFIFNYNNPNPFYFLLKEKKKSIKI